MKIKFRTAEHARRSKENVASWNALKAKYGVSVRQKLVTSELNRPVHPRLLEPQYPSLRSTSQSIAALVPAPLYTGTLMLGIATMHKSNSVPVFQAAAAIDIANMRRN